MTDFAKLQSQFCNRARRKVGKASPSLGVASQIARAIARAMQTDAK